MILVWTLAMSITFHSQEMFANTSTLLITRPTWESSQLGFILASKTVFNSGNTIRYVYNLIYLETNSIFIVFPVLVQDIIRFQAWMRAVNVLFNYYRIDLSSCWRKDLSCFRLVCLPVCFTAELNALSDRDKTEAQ